MFFTNKFKSFFQRILLILKRFFDYIKILNCQKQIIDSTKKVFNFFFRIIKLQKRFRFIFSIVLIETKQQINDDKTKIIFVLKFILRKKKQNRNR